MSHSPLVERSFLAAAILNLTFKKGHGGVFDEDVGSRDAAVKPPRMGLRRSSTDTPHVLNPAKILKLRIAVLAADATSPASRNR